MTNNLHLSTSFFAGKYPACYMRVWQYGSNKEIWKSECLSSKEMADLYFKVHTLVDLTIERGGAGRLPALLDDTIRRYRKGENTLEHFEPDEWYEDETAEDQQHG